MQINGYIINDLCCNSGGGIIKENKRSDIYLELNITKILTKISNYKIVVSFG